MRWPLFFPFSGKRPTKGIEAESNISLGFGYFTTDRSDTFWRLSVSEAEERARAF